MHALLHKTDRIGLWGWGREGRAAYAWLRQNPATAQAFLQVFCKPEEAVHIHALHDANLSVCTEVNTEAFANVDVLIKSPGISPYCDAVRAGQARGMRVIGGTALWFAAHPQALSLCVTGTKGKSTTSALLAHLLRAAGKRTALAGNIGLPLLELMHAQADAWVIELSSYQTRDVGSSGVRPALALVTNIYPEHLDWHGSQAQYVDDKLALLSTAAPHCVLLNADDAVLRARFADAEKAGLPVDTRVLWFNQSSGWHLREQILYFADGAVLDTRHLALAGAHNRSNLCGVLAALDAIGLDARALARTAHDFSPLPHRLQRLGVCDGNVVVVNDSISTTPHATLAALQVFAGERIALLLGGHDRGLDWHVFAEAMQHGDAACIPQVIVCTGQVAPRVQALLAPLAAQGRFVLRDAVDLADAVTQARTLLDGDGVLLLSPGAPSFGMYTDYVARGQHFAQLTGFDPAQIQKIQGMGVA